MVLVHYFLLGGIGFGEFGLHVCPGSGLCCSYNDFDHCTRSFVFSSSYFYCRFGASVMSLGNFVVVEARCNQYLGDINIFSLLKKLEKLFTK
jgi:hypothetical protein